MCGIVGYIGNRNSLSVIFDGLKRLEYRGYDSAGVALLTGDRIDVVKRIGNIKKLEEALPAFLTIAGMVMVFLFSRLLRSFDLVTRVSALSDPKKVH